MIGNQRDVFENITRTRKFLSACISESGEFLLTEAERAVLARTTVQYLKAFTTVETAYRQSYGMGNEENPTPVSISLLLNLVLADHMTGTCARPY